MNPFKKHRAVAAAMDRHHVDTDQIIPKQFLKRIERTGFGEFLFHDWRRRDDGTAHPDFELNRPEFQGAGILLARQNFGCGSSREHAPWALADYGFRVLIAHSFADIFYNNCFKNGLLPICFDDETMDELFRRAHEHAPHHLTVCLETCTVTDDRGLELTYEIDSHRRHCLLQGLDDIGLTLEHEDKITAFEAARGIGVP